MTALLQPGLKVPTLGNQRLRGGEADFLEAALLSGLDQVVLYGDGSVADGGLTLFGRPSTGPVPLGPIHGDDGLHIADLPLPDPLQRLL